jgi:hypothetical protein
MPEERTSATNSLSFSQQQEIDRLCTDFEAQWRRGLRPRIERVLGQVAANTAMVVTPHGSRGRSSPCTNLEASSCTTTTCLIAGAPVPGSLM